MSVPQLSYLLGYGTRLGLTSAEAMNAAIKATPADAPKVALLGLLQLDKPHAFDCEPLKDAMSGFHYGGPVDIPVPLRPPFPTTWFEYQAPGCGKDCRIGILCTAGEDGLWFSGVRTHTGQCGQFDCRAGWTNEFVPIVIDLRLDPQTGMAIVHPESPPEFPDCAILIVMGAAVDEAISVHVENGGPKRTVDEVVDENSALLRAMCYPVLFALSLLNTKNVASDIHEPSAALQRARARRGKPPLVTYRTLRVTLPHSRRSETPNPCVRGEGVALHLRRGHFKTYGEARPLLGRHTGTYWWQPSVRGDATRGVVVKDYELAGEQ